MVVIPLVNSRYGLIERLGKGGQGIVCMGVDTGAAGAAVTLKFVPYHEETDEAYQRIGLHREICENCKDPGIPAFRDFFTIDIGVQVAVLVLDYFDGRTLDKWAEGRSLQDALKVMLRICGTVEVLHREGYVHRDLSPDNMLISKSESVAVIDYDSAVNLNAPSGARPTAPNAAGPGKPRYAAPERTTQEHNDHNRRDAPAVDIFSLGRVLEDLLEWCTGKGRPVDGVRRIATKAVSSSQHDRHASVADLRRELEELLKPKTRGRP